MLFLFLVVKETASTVQRSNHNSLVTTYTTSSCRVVSTDAYQARVRGGMRAWRPGPLPVKCDKPKRSLLGKLGHLAHTLII